MMKRRQGRRCLGEAGVPCAHLEHQRRVLVGGGERVPRRVVGSGLEQAALLVGQPGQLSMSMEPLSVDGVPIACAHHVRFFCQCSPPSWLT